MNTDNTIAKKLRLYASSVLRYGISLVILWFGIQQLTNNSQWIAYVPDGVIALTHLSATTIVTLNGVFEVIGGLLLIIGWQTRWVALLLALHLLDIMYTVGYGQIGVRDFGLAIATVSIFMYGSDILCIY